MESFKPTRISGTVASTVIRTGPGKLAYVTIGTPITAGTITIYDNTAASGTVLALITCGATGTDSATKTYMINFQTGLTVATVGIGMDVTISSN
jgi:hypothetical protein